MRQIIESFKRLYQDNKIDKEVIESIYNKGTINESEKKYIMNIE